MVDHEVFLRQQDAWAFVEAIADPTERLLTELSLADALSFLVSDDDYRGRVASAPLDLLTFVRAVHALVQNKEVLRMPHRKFRREGWGPLERTALGFANAEVDSES
jgi:hypothetical protein